MAAVLLGSQRVTQIKALGVILRNDFSMSSHIDAIIVSCSQSLYAMSLLKTHGMKADELFKVFQATPVSKLMYAAPARWGFARAQDIDRIEAFLRRSRKLEYCSPNLPNAVNLCAKLDITLFHAIISNQDHVLHQLLPPLRANHYNMRERSHPYCLPVKTSTLNECNFVCRMLYKMN